MSEFRFSPPNIAKELAAERLKSILALDFPSLETLAPPSELAEEQKQLMLYVMTQHFIDENWIPQYLSHLAYTFGSEQKRIEMPGFSLDLLSKRLDEHTLRNIPSLLHIQAEEQADMPTFAASIPIWPDYSLDTSRKMLFSFNKHELLENAGPILKRILVKTAEAINLPIE